MKMIAWQVERLDELVSLWNLELGRDFPMRKELFKQNSFQDENVCYDASRIMVDEKNRVIGFIVGKRWQESLEVPMKDKTGWIQVILVHHEYRNKGIGSILLKHTEDAFKLAGMQEILLGKDPWHYFPGVPLESYEGWFEKKGYQSFGNEFDMLCKYEGEEAKELPSLPKVEFSLLKREEKDAFLAFLHRCFPGRWEYEAIHYFQKGGNGREFAILKKENKIIGFSRINDLTSPLIAQNVYWAPLFNHELGGVGPLGVDSNERGNGYGLAIVQAAIAFLRKRDVKNIVIDWTGLVDFYRKLDYDVWKSYTSYKKEL